MILNTAILIGTFTLTLLLIFRAVGIYFSFRNWLGRAWTGASSWVSEVTAPLFSWPKWLSNTSKVPTESAVPVLHGTNRGKGYGSILSQAREEAAAADREISDIEKRIFDLDKQGAEYDRIVEESQAVERSAKKDSSKKASEVCETGTPTRSAKARQERVLSLEKTKEATVRAAELNEKAAKLEGSIQETLATTKTELDEYRAMRGEIEQAGQEVEEIRADTRHMQLGVDELKKSSQLRRAQLKKMALEVAERGEQLGELRKLVNGLSSSFDDSVVHPASHSQPLFSPPLASSCGDVGNEGVPSSPVNNG